MSKRYMFCQFVKSICQFVEAGLVLDGETVEETFQRHRNDNDSLNMHHDKLQNLLGAEKKWKEIQDEDIYAPSFIDNFYPTRPSELKNFCLYDFVAHYKYDRNDKNGERKYRKLTKHVLPNHKIFNPLQEDERESYYYSLMILFVPFWNESGLILDGETVEEAFQRLRNDNDSLNMHHDKLQNLLGAEKKWKEIQDARKNIGLGEANETELKNRDNDEPQLLGEIMDAVNDIADMNNNVKEWQCFIAIRKEYFTK